MKDASAFPTEAQTYLVQGRVLDEFRSKMPETIDWLYQKTQEQAEQVGGDLHSQCSTVTLGRRDFALYISTPNQQAIFALVNSLNQGGKVHIQDVQPAYPISGFSQLAKSAWTRTGAKSPVEQSSR